jgi:1-deoxyxylulose-5-phosphate synthase
MDYLRPGSSGLMVSRIGLAMMSHGDPGSQRRAWREDDAEPIIRHAPEARITFFDTADMHSRGARVQITRRLPRKLFGQRYDYVLATKVYNPTEPGPHGWGCPASTCSPPSAPH